MSESVSKGDFIGGAFLSGSDASGGLKILSPANLKDTVFAGQFYRDHVRAACVAAKKAQPNWQRLGQEKRFEYLRRVGELYLSRKSELAETISREIGKPLWESEGEVASMISKIQVTLEESMDLVKQTTIDDIQPGLKGVTRYRARGVMAVLGPFNFPGHLPNGHFIPALATGNTIVFKPSDKAPLTGQIIAEVMQEAGLPEGVFNMIQGDADIGKRLITDEDIDGVLFTGSYTVGLKIKQKVLNQHRKILALEMGGKNTSIVWKDANFEQAVNENLVSAFVTSGQRCSCTSRVFVHEALYDQFLESFYESAKKIKIGHWSEAPFMGPLISESMVANYTRYQEMSTREGGRCVMRGKALELDYPGHYVTPSICEMDDYNPKSVFQKTELFSPNVTFYKVTDNHRPEMYNWINDPGFGLAASLFSSDLELYEEVFNEVKVGVLNLNRGTVGASARMPFGGIGKSGNDRPSAHFAVNYCTVPVASLEGEKGREMNMSFPGIEFVKGKS